MSFNKQATTWDADPKKIERAKAVAQEIKNIIPAKQNLSGFEFGCGTGLLSFELKDTFNNITLVDNSDGMIKVLCKKIQNIGIKNFTAVKANLIQNDYNFPKHDVIYTLMTLHHIQDINMILEKFNTILKQDGFLCIADLVKEDGSFHANNEDLYHYGFDRQELTEILQNHNFEVIYYNVCFIIEKEIDGCNNKYPLFLMICKKTT